jgi:hypothetical protein
MPKAEQLIVRGSMTRERLSSLSHDELKRIATRFRVKLKEDADRKTLIGVLLDHFADLEVEREESNNLQMRGEEKKYEVSKDEELGVSEFQEAYPIPRRYNETHIRAMVRDPEWAYAYWEVKESQLRELNRNPKFRGFFLRVHDVKDIQYNGTNSNSFFDIPLKLKDDHWYIHLPQPGRSYVMELIYVNCRSPHVLARSNVIHTPLGKVSESDSLAEESSPNELILALSTYNRNTPVPTSNSIPHRVSEE